MKAIGIESEQQRRRRVVSRIRNQMLAKLSEDLIELARSEKVPDDWMSVAQINQRLDDIGYWADHPDSLAAFLSPAACEELVTKALDELVCTYPDSWLRAGDQYKPAARDWNAYAAAKANLLRRQFPTEERTAFHAGADGASFLFGHDDYLNDVRAREEVTLLRKYLADAGIPELGFGLSDDGRTWVMAVWSDDEAALNQALFQAWQNAYGFAVQPAN